MEANRASPRVISLSILAALVAIACVPALLAGIGYAVPRLLDLARNTTGNAWFLPAAQIVSALCTVVVAVCTIVNSRRKWKQSAPKR